MIKSHHTHAAGYAVSLAVLAWLAASPANAQMYPPPAPYYGVGPGQVLERVQSMGLRPMSEPRLRGPVWVVRAVGREGTLVRVVVEAESGRVVDMVAIDRPYPPHIASGGPVREGPWVPMRGPHDDEDLPPPPVGRYGSPPGGGYAPGPQSSYGSGIDPRLSAPPEYRKGVNGNAAQPAKPEKKVASRPSTPLPKPKPADAAQNTDKKEKPAIAANPPAPETTGSIPSSDKKGATPTKTPDFPVQPLE